MAASPVEWVFLKLDAELLCRGPGGLVGALGQLPAVFEALCVNPDGPSLDSTKNIEAMVAAFVRSRVATGCIRDGQQFLVAVREGPSATHLITSFDHVENPALVGLRRVLEDQAMGGVWQDALLAKYQGRAPFECTWARPAC